MRTTHKTLILAVSAALLTSGSLYAQKGPDDGIQPSGPSTSGALGALPGQTCTGSGGTDCGTAIPDNSGSLITTMDVVSCPLVVSAVVGLDVTHTWVGDLIFTVTAPDGASVVVYDRPGRPDAGPGVGCSGNNVFAALDDAAGSPVEDECADADPTIGGTFSPNNPLAGLAGALGTGAWQLEVSDNAGLDTGNMNDWSLELTCASQDDAIFTVNKDFTDGNTAGVDVTLDCFQGLPITQTQTVSEAQNVVFTVQDFAQGTLDCNLTEDGSSGYTASYDEGDGVSAVNCSWQDLVGDSTYVCDITNTPDPVEITVSKDWVIEGESVNYIDPSYYLELECNNEIVGGYQYYDRGSDNWYAELYDGDSNGTSDVDYTADVIPNWDGGTDCSVYESHYDSAIESSNNCSALHINIIEDETDVRSCTVTNSVFFEGIPSLNQYGLAILALLMLSVGFVGFRRFV